MLQESAPVEERSGSVSVEGTGQEPPAEGNTRRGLIVGAGLAGVAGVLAACGGSSGSGSSAAGSTTPAAQPPGDTPTEGTAPGPSAKGLAKTSDIPVGGGKVFKAEKVVVTQPTAGEFRAFSAVCTHMGCTVASVSGGTINCPCHGSKFKITDASVAAGPAPGPLATKKVDVQGGELTVT